MSAQPLPELDRTTWPEWRDRVQQYAPSGPPSLRAYPGHLRWPLPRLRARWWPSLDRILARRRSAQALSETPPDRTTLARILQFSHGVTGPDGRGPAPSAGGLQAVELYLVAWTASWLPVGVYHYGRAEHALAQVTPDATRERWRTLVPSLATTSGGALLWLLVGDEPRVAEKYSDRAARFLTLEAGHVMQSLCLTSASLGWTTTPLGAFLEPDIRRELRLPPTDLVLYAGLLGR